MNEFCFQIIKARIGKNGNVRKIFPIIDGEPIKIVASQATHVRVYGERCSFGIVKNPPSSSVINTKKGTFYQLPGKGETQVIFRRFNNRKAGRVYWQVFWN